jgi:hypothetical protein
VPTPPFDTALANLLRLLPQEGQSPSFDFRTPSQREIGKLIDAAAKFAFEIQEAGDWQTLVDRAGRYEKRTEQGSEFDKALQAVLRALRSHPGANVSPPKPKTFVVDGRPRRKLWLDEPEPTDLERLDLPSVIASLEKRDKLLWSLRTASKEAARIEPLIGNSKPSTALRNWIAELRKLEAQELKGHARGSLLIRLACDARESTAAESIEKMLLEVLPLEWEENCRDLAQAALYFPQRKLRIGASAEFPYGPLTGTLKSLAAASVPILLNDPMNVDSRVLKNLAEAGKVLLKRLSPQVWDLYFNDDETYQEAKRKHGAIQRAKAAE